ncbi:MAG: ribbon-helix-helix protein, CopG family [Phycisphaerales bacterium]|nr:ribbon-helix-helix protein, CopG family [Phycisphaerales bacterium]
MKTAVSIPDDVYREAERLARRLQTTRSDVYRRALAEFVARHSPDRVTEALDQVCDRLVQQLGAPAQPGVHEPKDAFTAAAAAAILEKAEW